MFISGCKGPVPLCLVNPYRCIISTDDFPWLAVSSTAAVCNCCAHSIVLTRSGWKSQVIIIFLKLLCIYRAFSLFIVYYLYQQMHTHTHTHTHIYIYIYIKIPNYIKNAATCFVASALSSGSFDIAFVKLM